MTYHFVVTLAFASGMADANGTYDAKPGETRKDVYERLIPWAKQRAAGKGYTGGSTVVFFSLEPDDLAIGGAR